MTRKINKVNLAIFVVAMVAATVCAVIGQFGYALTFAILVVIMAAILIFKPHHAEYINRSLNKDYSGKPLR